MISHCEDEHPWLFARTEADELEDWYNQLLELDEESALEDCVLEEQRCIEERARRSIRHIERRLEEGDLFGEHVTPFVPVQGALSMRASLCQSVQVSELYGDAVRWTREVGGWARELYPSRHDPGGHLFRVALHALVVPSKIRFAEEEEQEADPFGVEFAHLEYCLAHDYLQAALRALRDLPPVFLVAQAFYAQGCLLKEQLVEARRTLESRHAFRLRRL